MVELIGVEDIEKLAKRCCEEVIPKMENVRELADKLERNVADRLWPLPKYTELFLNI
jgi:glutamine synthetase